MANREIKAEERLQQRVNYFKWLKDKSFVLITVIYLVTTVSFIWTQGYYHGTFDMKMSEVQKDLKEVKGELLLNRVYTDELTNEYKILQEKLK